MPWLCILLQSHIHVGWNAAHVYTWVLRVSYEKAFFITKSAILISILFSPCLTFTLFATQSILSHCYRWWLCTQMLRKIFAFCCARQTDSSIVSFRVEKHSKFNLHCVQFASAYIARLLKFESGAEICKSTWHNERRRHFVFDVAKDCWNYACDTFSLLQIYFLPFFQESRNISSIPKVDVAQKFVCMSHAHGK